MSMINCVKRFQPVLLYHRHAYCMSLSTTKVTNPNLLNHFMKTQTCSKSIICSSDALINNHSCLFHISHCLTKSKKHSSKIQQVIRPADAAHILDLEEVQNNMKALLANLKEDFAKDFRVGADIAIDKLEIKVDGDYYSLNELAQITKQSSRLILLDMIEFPEYIKVVEKAVRESKWNLNPSITGTIIKVPIPQATAERRKQIAQSAKDRMISCKLDLRKLVETTCVFVFAHENTTEDLNRIIKQQIQIYCDHYTAEVVALYKGKENEILKPS